VISVDILEVGDHVKWKRAKWYDHHGIVEYMDHQSGDVGIIEYGSDTDGGVITRNVINGVSGMYKYLYDRCSDARQVLQRAILRIGERNYNLFTNNCEHFATRCKTGQAYSSQIADLVTCTQTHLLSLHRKLRAEVYWGAIRKAVCKGKGKGLTDIGSVVIAALIEETVLFFDKYCEAQNNYTAAVEIIENDMPEISEEKRNELKVKCEEERKRVIEEAACASTGAFVGTVVGSEILGFIPVIGTEIGILGGMCGRWLVN